jgi:SAM-dependent methyltransferase
MQSMGILKSLRTELGILRYRYQASRSFTGMYPRQCNICGYQGLFAFSGTPPRRDARCKNCNSLERHRHLGLWIEQARDELKARDVLHFAPEPAVTNLVRPIAKTYLSADITPGRADAVLDIVSIAKPDESFDWIICSHVLEHIDDDARALAELYRVLRRGGILTIMVPIVEGWDQTYTDPAIKSPAGRDLHFGQGDHVRYYGRDLRDRVIAAEFKLSEVTAVEPEVSRHSLLRGDKIFIARKPL